MASGKARPRASSADRGQCSNPTGRSYGVSVGPRARGGRLSHVTLTLTPLLDLDSWLLARAQPPPALRTNVVDARGSHSACRARRRTPAPRETICPASAHPWSRTAGDAPSPCVMVIRRAPVAPAPMSQTALPSPPPPGPFPPCGQARWARPQRLAPPCLTAPAPQPPHRRASIPGPQRVGQHADAKNGGGCLCLCPDVVRRPGATAQRVVRAQRAVRIEHDSDHRVAAAATRLDRRCCAARSVIAHALALLLLTGRRTPSPPPSSVVVVVVLTPSSSVPCLPRQSATGDQRAQVTS